jgi:hypothetical protein
MVDASGLRRGALALFACGLALFLLPAVAGAAGEYESNDLRETAYGPLAGGADYTATFETNNDVDWYVFYIKTYSQMDFSATKVAPTSCSGVAHLELRDKDGKTIEYFHSGVVNETEHLRTTLTAGRYYLEVTNHGCVGDRYRFRIDPAASLTTSRTCGEALVARDTVTPELVALNAKIAKNGEVLAKAETQLAARRAALRKLKNRPHASRSTKRRAREKLLEAKAKKEKIEIARIGLQTLGAQYTATLNQANGQIATSC